MVGLLRLMVSPRPSWPFCRRRGGGQQAARQGAQPSGTLHALNSEYCRHGVHAMVATLCLCLCCSGLKTALFRRHLRCALPHS